jgi:hypothetical protein
VYPYVSLISQHGFYGGHFYLGLLHTKERYPIIDIAKYSKRHPRSIDRQVKKAIATENIEDLRLGTEDLPPLSIDCDLVHDRQIATKVFENE